MNVVFIALVECFFSMLYTCSYCIGIVLGTYGSILQNLIRLFDVEQPLLFVSSSRIFLLNTPCKTFVIPDYHDDNHSLACAQS